MDNSSLVSIIIPSYNRAHLIGETLDSVLAQTHQNWECIVVDDGSTDGTDKLMIEYMSKDARFHYHHRPKNRLPGGNAARNYGFEVSKGVYVQWFDSDDLMLPEKLQIKVDVLREKNVDFVVCENEEIYSFTPYLTKKRWEIERKGDPLLNHLKGEIAFDTAGPLFKSDFLKNKSLFDEGVLIGQEWEFYSRLLLDKPNIKYIHKPLYHFKNLKDGIRENQNKDKIRNRAQTELKLFKLIVSRKYFNKSPYKTDFNRFLFFKILRSYKHLKSNLSLSLARKYVIKGLGMVDSSYYFKSALKSLQNPHLIRNTYNKIKGI